MQKYLIVGLGNVGEKYQNTRHNIGFLVVDAIAKALNAVFEAKSFGNLCKTRYKGRQLLLLKPDTYMNLSGNSVAYWIKKENISLEEVLVVTDDLNLGFGTLRIKGKGSNGGHNGLKSVENTLMTSKYPRLRLGISSEYKKGQQIDYVLGEWNQEEEKRLPKIISRSKEAALSFCFNGIAHAMNNYNGVVEL